MRLLGPFEARWRDGEPVDLTGKKVQALVAYLGVEGGRDHPREELATLLCAETGEDRARHNLRQALSKIRRVGGDLLIARDDRLRLSELCGVQLLEAATGKHMWAQRFDRELEDVFALQDEITETVVSTLAGRLEAVRIARARRMPAERLDA